MTELARVQDPQVGSAITAKIEYANELAKSSLLPKSYRQQPANILLAMELGDALGIPHIQAINGIHVIEGKPSASAELIASLVRKAGHKLRVLVDAKGLRVKAQIIRSDDPDHTFEALWDMERARGAGLANKDNWKKDPIAMMTARAITQVARQGASDALYGVSHTQEELSFTVPAAAQLHQQRVTAAEILGQADDVVDAETIDEETGEIHEAQQSDENAWDDVQVAPAGGVR